MSSQEYYVHPDHAGRLRAVGLDHIDALWDLDLATVEPANLRRGGFSSVCRLQVDGQHYFIKRQENQLRRTWLSPQARPTYYQEYLSLRRFHEADQDAPVPQCAFYGERKLAGRHQAVLVTPALEGFRDLLSASANGEDLHGLMPQVGRALFWFHRQRFQHMAVYPAHVFVSNEGQCRLIDLERGRYRMSGRRAMVRDLAKLRQRSPWMDDVHLECLLGAYPEDWRQVAREALGSHWNPSGESALV